ncbi:hypothetical protein N9D22_05210 [Flavobacteriaceae bacterium]|nr:hypothetical protein [Flavobacteriaceae bacterium]
MGYNKPITARIQHSTNKGMKVQEPLLDIGSAVKKKELNYGADTSLTSGVENSKFVDIAKPVKEAIDGEPEAAAKKALKGGQNTLPIELQNAIKAAPGKNYKKGYYGK